jgi:tetratricopeptide (TPR) repeat protein
MVALVVATMPPLAFAQAPPGCYSPRFSGADQVNAENNVKEIEKRNPHSPELADALEHLADTYRDFQEDKALSTLNRALSIRESFAGKKNARSPAGTLVKIADTYEMHGKYAEAMKQLDRAEQITKHDVNRIVYIDIYNILYHQANCLLSMQPHDAAKAEEKAKAMLALAEKKFGPDSAHVYQALPILMTVYFATNRQPQAKAIQARMDALFPKLGNPVTGLGTARHLDLDPLLRNEEAKL